MRQVGDNVSDLSCTSHTLASSDGLSNRRDGDGCSSIIEGTVDSSHVPLFCMDPLQEHSNLIECERRDQTAREIDMDFIRTTRRVRAQFANSSQSICLYPREGIPSKTPFGSTPLSTEDFMVS